eukprot:6195434-Amphidinium_carterae.1
MQARAEALCLVMALLACDIAKRASSRSLHRAFFLPWHPLLVTSSESCWVHLPLGKQFVVHGCGRNANAPESLPRAPEWHSPGFGLKPPTAHDSLWARKLI